MNESMINDSFYRVGKAKRNSTDLQGEAQGQPAGQEPGGGV